MNYIKPTTYMEINMKNFVHNIKEIKKFIGDKVEIMPILKANAYGTYLNKHLDILNMFNIVGVAKVIEGIHLRNIGYKKDIFILNQPAVNEINDIIKYNLTIGISENDFIKELGKKKNKVKIHVEIGTGMGRTGINPIRVQEYVNMIQKYKNIEIEGIYTHLSSADTDYSYTLKQLQNFDNAIIDIKKLVPNIKYIHASASNGIINFPNSHYNLVRPGIIIYGFPSSNDTYKKINIKPVSILKSKITFIKESPKNASIGYGRNFITKRKSIIATIPIGYADGLKRSLSNKGKVIINGHLAPIVGNICMDSFMADVTKIPNVKLNDDVFIWDNDKIKVEDVAKNANTINYEILTSITDRVPRIIKIKKQ